MKIGVLLTQWKRSHLESQLINIYNQTIKPDYIVVFQNENYIDITELKKKYNFIHVKSDYNTKFFGRFAYFLTLPVDICIVMDDDIIPGTNCIQNYVQQCMIKNAIIGGNGRVGKLSPYLTNQDERKNLPDIGIRRGLLADFVGHMWVFKKDWLYYMFSVKPYTYDTGEDMHLCFSSKLLGGINSYIGEHKTKNDMSDIAMNKLCSDNVSSFKTTNPEIRKNIERYWIEKGLKFIQKFN
jgi:hypothetical protein